MAADCSPCVRGELHLCRALVAYLRAADRATPDGSARRKTVKAKVPVIAPMNLNLSRHTRPTARRNSRPGQWPKVIREDGTKDTGPKALGLFRTNDQASKTLVETLFAIFPSGLRPPHGLTARGPTPQNRTQRS